MSKNESQKKLLTEEQVRQLRSFSAIRLPMEQIASIFQMSKDTLERLCKKNDTVRAAIEEGRATASANVRKTLYQMATGTPGDRKNRIEAIPPSLGALKYWCSTQENFVTTERLQHTGADGGAIRLKEESLTPEQKTEKLTKLSKMLKLTE
jgi:predicted DNA-binding protein YlxM (UPF0122 family)